MPKFMMQYNISWLYVYFANLGGLALAKMQVDANRRVLSMFYRMCNFTKFAFEKKFFFASSLDQP